MYQPQSNHCNSSALMTEESEVTIRLASPSTGETLEISALENDSLQTLKLLVFAQKSITLTGKDFTLDGMRIADSTMTLKQLNLTHTDSTTVLSTEQRPAPVNAPFNFGFDAINNNDNDTACDSEAGANDSFFSESSDSIEPNFFDDAMIDEATQNQQEEEYLAELQPLELIPSPFSFAPVLKRQNFKAN